MRRKIITIDEEKCNGCGACESGCPEGALRVIDGKARLVGELLCDGLGACLGTCPEGAITVEEREAEPYDELAVIRNIVPQGRNVILAHLQHLKDHGQSTYLKQAVSYLREHKIAIDMFPQIADHNSAGAARQCPGSKTLSFPAQRAIPEGEEMPSQLTHWPVQLHLINPAAPHYRNSDLLIAADCVAYAYADFHRTSLRGRTLAIACSKLDARQEVYADKIAALIDESCVKSIRVMIMQVPCCSGLLRHVVDGAGRARRRVPVSCVIVGIGGEILSETPIDIESTEAVG